MPARNKIVEVFHIDREAFSHRLLKTAVTFFLFSFALIFFGKDTFAQGLIKAAELIEDGRIDEFVKERYASYQTGIGATIRSGEG